ncbi:hypothetical protein GCM10008957_56050 [Deinococcus ruber]|uniref:Uncharacterized protein n=1 Tax=Deinococcus ruber TaxID=1848197 RepID=A0A918FIK6_9DEIO|nr:hypothetical protein GCM10008957_56050 [Deinococcus ruber]
MAAGSSFGTGSGKEARASFPFFCGEQQALVPAEAGPQRPSLEGMSKSKKQVKPVQLRSNNHEILRASKSAAHDKKSVKRERKYPHHRFEVGS